MQKPDFNRIVEKIQNEIKLVSSTLKDKGTNRFGRAILVALCVPLAAYQLVYAPSKKKLYNLDGEIKTAQTRAQNVDTYSELKTRLNMAYAQLPLPKDRANWLGDTVKEALRSQGIVASGFAPPTEEETNGVVVQDLNITMDVKFSDLMGFLARVEATKPMLLVTHLEMTKKVEQIGRNEVTCGLRTIILTERF